jgi:hypothetical protein
MGEVGMNVGGRKRLRGGISSVEGRTCEVEIRRGVVEGGIRRIGIERGFEGAGRNGGVRLRLRLRLLLAASKWVCGRVGRGMERRARVRPMRSVRPREGEGGRTGGTKKREGGVRGTLTGRGGSGD